MNRKMNMPQLARILMEFERQSEIMGAKDEMMSSTLDDALDEAGDEEETEEVVNRVLDEIGVNLNDSMVNAPATELPKAPQNEAEESDALLMERLNNLRKA